MVSLVSLVGMDGHVPVIAAGLAINHQIYVQKLFRPNQETSTAALLIFSVHGIKKKSFVIEAQREIILNMTFYQPRSRRYKFVL